MLKPDTSFEAAPQDMALTLLGAVAFSIIDRTTLSFGSDRQAVSVLSQPLQHLPRSSEGWTAQMEPEDVRARRKALRRLAWNGAQYRLTYRWRTVQGEFVWIEERGSRRAGTEDGVTHIDGVFTNVTAQRRETQRAGFLSTHDGLTEIANRKTLHQSLNHLAALSDRQSGEGAFLRVRLLNLTDINAVYGYETGDRLLIELAKRLSDNIRMPDVVGRISGPDFGIVFYGANDEAFPALAERLVLELEDTPVVTPHGGLYMEIGAGSTRLRTNARSAEEAFAQTAIALEGAKPSQVRSYTPVMGLGHVPGARETTSEDVLDALNQRRIRLAYQPIIDAKTRQLHHYECLLRLCREDGEIVSAGQFIMAAERLGLVHLLDRRALELAAETLASDHEVHLALNVSAGTVKDPEAASGYITALRTLGQAAERVTLELTETVALDDPAMASDFSNEVRSVGSDFAIDDFGSGYTTFRNLMAIEAEMIKIDGTLIEGIAFDPNKQTFVRMMVDLAQTFSVKTVAEMVDDRADADMLCRLGVDYLQGFMFGVPSAAAAWQKRAG